ncbi:MAG: ribosome-associated translation inhibitor RaiA [Spirochaetes bacterium]|nr:ribosome-associated translation inhibitor RaiA [Spirochaetota bacterium]
MNFNIQGSSNFNVSDRMRQYIEKRMKKIDYFKHHINEIKFHLDKEKKNYRIDAVVITKKFGSYKFEAKDKEMYDTIDRIVHKIDVKIHREKSKITNHSNAGHEEIGEFFTEHEESKPEPTVNISINQKPKLLTDALLEMEEENNDFFGFRFLEENNGDENHPAFFRKLGDMIYLLKRKDDEHYAEYTIQRDKQNVEIKNENRMIPLEKMNLLTAQKKILEQDFHYDLFIDNNNEISCLYKGDNGKWKLLS